MNREPSSILIVEDDYLDVLHAENELKKLDMHLAVHVAANGLEALDLLRGENGETAISPMPKLILLDINMPKMNGIEFLDVLRSDVRLRHLKVFVLTGSDEETDRLAARNLEVDGYFVKPLSFEIIDSSPANAHSLKHMLELLNQK